MPTVKVDQLSQAVAERMVVLQQFVEDELKEVQMTVADAVVDIVKRSGTYKDRTGDYREGITHTKPIVKRGRSYVKVWGGNKGYRVTHLLEYGHAKVSGGRVSGMTKKYPHFEVGQEWLDNNYTRMLKEKIENDIK